MAAQFSVNARCDRITPFGFPVDPDVYCMNAVASGSRFQIGSFSSSSSSRNSLAVSNFVSNPSTTHIWQFNPCVSNNFNLVNFNAVAIFELHTTPAHSFASVFKNSYLSLRTSLAVVMGSIGYTTHGTTLARISAKNTGNQSTPGS